MSYPDASHTRVRITVGSHEEQPFDRAQILGVSVTKGLGGSSGTWSATIKAPPGAPDWLRDWPDPEAAWLKIEWLIDGVVIDGMIGQVDTITEARQRVGAGAESTVYTLRGRDVGKVLEMTPAFVAPYDFANAAVVGISGIYQRAAFAVDGAPGDFVAALVDVWLGNNGGAMQPWRLPDGFGRQSAYALLLDRIGCRDPEIDGRDFSEAILHPSGSSLWSLLQEYANGLLNELFVDLVPPEGEPADARAGLLPAIVLRRKPFPTRDDRSAWESLRTHELSLADITAHQLVKGAPEARFTWWELEVGGIQGQDVRAILQQYGAQDGRPGSIPIFNVQQIERYGLRRYQQSTRFLPLVRDTTQNPESANFVRLAADWLRRLHDWYATAPYETTGTITLSRARPEIRVGQRIRVKRATGAWVAYVENVETSWSFGSAGRTTLTVTRGTFENDDVLERVYASFDEGQSARAVCLVPEDAEGRLTNFDEANAALRDGCELRVELSPRAFVREGVDPAEGVISEGDGFEVEQADTTPAEQPGTRAPRDSPSPAEERSRRAYQGVPEAPTDGRVADVVSFDTEALESGEPIPISDDPIGGLEDL